MWTSVSSGSSTFRQSVVGSDNSRFLVDFGRMSFRNNDGAAAAVLGQKILDLRYNKSGLHPSTRIRQLFISDNKLVFLQNSMAE